MSSRTSPSGCWKRRARSTSVDIASWKRRRLNRPVSSSVTAWRSTVSCRPTFSIATAACSAGEWNGARPASLERAGGGLGEVVEELALGQRERAVASRHRDDARHARLYVVAAAHRVRER